MDGLGHARVDPGLATSGLAARVVVGDDGDVSRSLEGGVQVDCLLVVGSSGGVANGMAATSAGIVEDVAGTEVGGFRFVADGGAGRGAADGGLGRGLSGWSCYY